MQRKLIVLLILMSVALQGCLWKRHLLSIEDGPQKSAMVQTADQYFPSGLFGKTYHQFWECKDEGEKVVCQKACGDDTDLACPIYRPNNPNPTAR